MVGSSNSGMVVESMNRLIVECMVVWLNRRTVYKFQMVKRLDRRIVEWWLNRDRLKMSMHGGMVKSSNGLGFEWWNG